MTLIAFGILANPVNGEMEYPIKNCLEDKLDLIFIEDTSTLPEYSYMASQEYKYKAFLEVFTKEEPATEMERVRMAFASFSDNVTVHLNFREKYDDVQAAARNISHTVDNLVTGESNTGQAIRFILEDAFTPEMGSRPTAQHIAILLVQRLPTVDVALAREMTARLAERSDIRVIVYHSLEKLDISQSILPMKMVFQVDRISHFDDTHIRKLCKPCLHGKLAVPEFGSVSCYFVIKPLNGSKGYDQSLKHCQNSQQSLSKDSNLAQIETDSERMALERAVFDYARKNLPENELFMTDIALYRMINTVAQRFGWRNGRPLLYRNWDYRHPGVDHTSFDNEVCVHWRLQRLNPVYDPQKWDRPGTNFTYDWWRGRYYGMFTSMSCDVSTSYVLCEEKFKVVYEKLDGEVSSSVPSVHSVREAMAKGQYIYIDQNENTNQTTHMRQGKLMSLSCALPKMMSSDSEFKVNSKMNNFSQVFIKQIVKHAVLFDCEAQFNQELLSYNRVCDQRVDCSTGRDETICGEKGYRGCMDSESKCTSGQCVPREAWCDLYPDCLDGSDEENCVGKCKHHHCMMNTASEVCLPKSMVFDGERDCLDEDRRYWKFSQCLGECNRTKCLTREMILDVNNTVYCQGPEGHLDVVLRALEGTYCYNDYGAIHGREDTWAPRCIYIKNRYETIIGCTDFQHLRNCENVTCPEGYYKCPKSYCIPLHYARNQIPDCPYGEDEEVQNIIENSNFQCLAIGDSPPVLLHPSLVCDGNTQCPSGDDEMDCNITCREGFLCTQGVVTVIDYSKDETLEDLSFIDSRTKYLDLSGVKLIDFFLRFPHYHFMNVLLLNMSHCKLENVQINSFVVTDSKIDVFGNAKGTESAKYLTPDFSTVMRLDLSHNQLTSLEGLDSEFPEFSALGAMNNLQHLFLSHNPNLVISSAGFIKIAEHILTLDLSFTPLYELQNQFIDMFESLVTLSIEGTHISRLPRVFPSTLQVLNIRSIPLVDIEPGVFKGLYRMQQLSASSYKLCCPQVRGQSIPAHACLASGDAVSSCYDLIQEPILRILLWIFGSAALLGNIIVIVYRITWDRTVLKRGYGIFVINLSLSDLMMGIYLLMIASADLQFSGEYIWFEKSWRESSMCHLAGFLSTWSCESSAIFIFLITLDRFIVIRFPFGQVRLSITGYIVSSTIAWLSGLVLALMPLLPPFRNWSTYSSNAMCLGLPLTTDKTAGWEYSTSVFVGINFVLFMFIASGQIAIYRTMSSSRIVADDSMSKFQSMRRQQAIAVAKQLSLVVISDFLCWFPIGTMGMIALAGNDLGSDVYAWTAVLVLPVNSAINPVLYTVPTLKKVLEEFISKLRNRASIGSKSEMKCNEDVTDDLNNYMERLKALFNTLKSAKDFFQNESKGKEQEHAIRAQAPGLNTELKEMKELLNAKMGNLCKEK